LTQETKALANPKDTTLTHIANIGRLIEDMENRLRNTVDVVYFGRTQEVLSYLREIRGTKEAKERAAAQKKVIGEMSQAASATPAE
jgi:capping protein beta